MMYVNFSELVSGESQEGWTFRKEYPSKLNTTTTGEELWLSEEKLRVPVGSKKIALKLFLWVWPDEMTETFSCRLGMVPEKSSLDEKALEILNRLTRRKFTMNPYYHLVNQKEYREIFLEQSNVLVEDVVGVVEDMKSAASFVEANILEFMEGDVSTESLSLLGENESAPQNGWSVLVRARSGSI